MTFEELKSLRDAAGWELSDDELRNVMVDAETMAENLKTTLKTFQESLPKVDVPAVTAQSDLYSLFTSKIQNPGLPGPDQTTLKTAEALNASLHAMFTSRLQNPTLPDPDLAALKRLGFNPEAAPDYSEFTSRRLNPDLEGR